MLKDYEFYQHGCQESKRKVTPLCRWRFYFVYGEYDRAMTRLQEIMGDEPVRMDHPLVSRWTRSGSVPDLVEKGRKFLGVTITEDEYGQRIQSAPAAAASSMPFTDLVFDEPVNGHIPLAPEELPVNGSAKPGKPKASAEPVPHGASAHLVTEDSVPNGNGANGTHKTIESPEPVFIEAADDAARQPAFDSIFNSIEETLDSGEFDGHHPSNFVDIDAALRSYDPIQGGFSPVDNSALLYDPIFGSGANTAASEPAPGYDPIMGGFAAMDGTVELSYDPIFGGSPSTDEVSLVYDPILGGPALTSVAAGKPAG